MIHVVTLSDWPDAAVERLRQRLYMAFGLGADQAGPLPPPESARRDEGFDAVRLLADAPAVPAYGDDKVLYVIDAPLVVPEGPMGRPPNPGFSDPESGRAVVGTPGLVARRPTDEEGWLALADRVARHAVQQVGILWGLRRCPDARCAMSIPWSVPDREDVAGATLCEWCRNRSEERMRQSRT